MTLSTHASKRAKQRGIPPLIIQWLEAFGEHAHDHNGGRTPRNPDAN